ncbi:MAG TPA: hypothetical protein VF793_14955 [Telluria sp.]
MCTQQILVFLGAASLSLSVFAAPTNIPAPASVDSAAHGMYGQHKLDLDDAQDMQGVYRLADGRRLTVTNEDSRLFIKLDGKREALSQVGPTSFVSHDTGTRVTFNQVPFADKVVVDQAAH